jgi:hypothetical protein
MISQVCPISQFSNMIMSAAEFGNMIMSAQFGSMIMSAPQFGQRAQFWGIEIGRVRQATFSSTQGFDSQPRTIPVSRRPEEI